MNTKDIVVSVFSVAIKIVVTVIVVMFIYKYAKVAYDYGYRIFSEQPMSSGEGRIVNVTIGSDTDPETVGELLESKGLIRDAKLFVLQERLSENHGKIQPGIYDLNTTMTAEEMIAIMSNSYEGEEEIEDNNYINAESENPFVEDDMSDSMSDEGMVDPMSDEGMAVEGYEPIAEGDAASEGEVTE